MRQLALVPALIVALALSAQAKDLTSWDNLAALKKGEAIEVTRKTGSELPGQFTTSTPDAIAVQTKKGEVTIPRPEIATVGSKQNSSNTGRIVGTAIGAAGGLAAGAAIGAYLSNEGQADKAAVTAAGTAIGAAIGLGIGWGIHGGYKTIYKGQ